MPALPGFLTRNWRLKLLAVGLAVFAWTVVVYAGNPPDSRTVTAAVPQDASSLPQPFVLASKIPDLAVRVQGTKEHVDAFDPADLQVIVDYRSIHSAGLQQVPVTIVNNDSDVDLDNPPTSVSADVDVTASTTVPIHIVVPRTQQPPPGYVISSETVTPAQLTVFGPKRELSGVQAEVDVDLSNRKIPLDQTYTVRLVGPGGRAETNLGVAESTETTVNVHIDIATANTTRVSVVFPATPPGLVGPGHYLTGIAVNPPTVTLTGPEELLNTLDSVGTTPLTQLGLNADTDETVRLILPNGVTADHATVSVHLSVGTIAPPPTPTPGPTPTPSPSPNRTPTPGPSPTPSPTPVIPTPTPSPSPRPT